VKLTQVRIERQAQVSNTTVHLAHAFSFEIQFSYRKLFVHLMAQHKLIDEIFMVLRSEYCLLSYCKLLSMYVYDSDIYLDSSIEGFSYNKAPMKITKRLIRSKRNSRNRHLSKPAYYTLRLVVNLCLSSGHFINGMRLNSIKFCQEYYHFVVGTKLAM
jgi:hypothetical protein